MKLRDHFAGAAVRLRAKTHRRAADLGFATHLAATEFVAIGASLARQERRAARTVRFELTLARTRATLHRAADGRALRLIAVGVVGAERSDRLSAVRGRTATGAGRATGDAATGTGRATGDAATGTGRATGDAATVPRGTAAGGGATRPAL